MDEQLLKPFEQLVAAQGAYEEALCTAKEAAPAIFRALCDMNSWTQRRLAAELRVDFTYISKVVHGAMSPGLPLVKRVVEVFTPESRGTE